MVKYYRHALCIAADGISRLHALQSEVAIGLSYTHLKHAETASGRTAHRLRYARMSSMTATPRVARKWVRHMQRPDKMQKREDE